MNEWIEWGGGECPVDGDVRVKYRMREDDDGWHDDTQACDAARLDWSHCSERERGHDIVAYRVVEEPSVSTTALAEQPGGSHYRDCKIQPVEFIEANRLGFLEGSIIKRATRHGHATGKGAEDIRKIIHEAQLLLELRYGGEAA